MRTRPGIISTLEVGSSKIRRDEAGYLVDPDEWSREVAEVIALEEKISLDDEHWAILEFMRAYFGEHGIAADARFAFAFLAEHNNQTAGDARRRFFELFPYGYVAQTCRIAGMRQPKAWSTG